MADSELELVPKEIVRTPAILKSAQMRRKDASGVLLDSSNHFASMKGLKEWQRRGRPDIVHFCLLLALDSQLNREGGLKVVVHTRNDEVIEFASETRLPRIYGRFTGLMEDLFKKGKIVSPEGRTLMRLKRKTLLKLLEETGVEPIVFDESGEKLGITELAKLLTSNDACVVIGGFPSGGFKSKCLEGCKKVSVAHEPLCAWSVLAKAVVAREAALEGA